MSIKIAAVLVVAVFGVASAKLINLGDGSTSSQSCSSPPPSLEVCLSSIFSSIESDLMSISISLKSHEKSLHTQMAYEKYAVSGQLSAISKARKIAKSVKSVVNSDYSAIKKQMKNLYYEKTHLKYMKQKMIAQLQLIETEQKSVNQEIVSIYNEYQTIKKAHWQVSDQISAVGHAKAVIVKEETEIEAVIAQLNIEISKIYEKLSEMNKRQIWLESWEVKLSVDLSDFNYQVKKFKEVQYDVVHRVKYLKLEQKSLQQELISINQKMVQLSVHYEHISEYLYDLQQYYLYLYQAEKNVYNEGLKITGAFSDFTCMEELLKAEACNSKPANNGKAPAGKPAGAAAPVLPPAPAPAPVPKANTANANKAKAAAPAGAPAPVV